MCAYVYEQQYTGMYIYIIHTRIHLNLPGYSNFEAKVLGLNFGVCLSTGAYPPKKMPQKKTTKKPFGFNALVMYGSWLTPDHHFGPGAFWPGRYMSFRSPEQLRMAGKVRSLESTVGFVENPQNFPHASIRISSVNMVFS